VRRGTARFAYNWALAEWGRQYEVWKADNRLPRPSQAALRREFHSLSPAAAIRAPPYRLHAIMQLF